MKHRELKKLKRQFLEAYERESSWKTPIPMWSYCEPQSVSPDALVREFHEVFGLPVQNAARPVSLAEETVRRNLLAEEYLEVMDELKTPVDISKLAKELADLVYVTYGTALTYGINLDAVLEEVHRSNMSKLGSDGNPIFRSDGKVLKGPNYQEADLSYMFQEDAAQRSKAAFLGLLQQKAKARSSVGI